MQAYAANTKALIPQNAICTLNVLGEDEGSACMGDSGGPLSAMIDNEYVAGITSAGQGSMPISCT